MAFCSGSAGRWDLPLRRIWILIVGLPTETKNTSSNGTEFTNVGRRDLPRFGMIPLLVNTTSLGLVL